MNFNISSSKLLKHLQSIVSVLTPSTNTITECFLFDIKDETLSISATDKEKETFMTTSLEVQSEDNGKIAIPAKILMDTLKTLPEQPISFSVNIETFGVEMTAGKGKYKFVGEDPIAFPKPVVIEKPNSINIFSSILGDAISKTLFAVSSDDSRLAMTGVYCQITPENITFVSTDAHKLVKYSYSEFKTETTANFILPKKALSLLKSSLPSENTLIKIEYNINSAVFRFNNIYLNCRLIDARYPEYNAVIPTNNPNKLQIDRQTFVSSLKRVSLFANKTTYQVRLKMTPNELLISAEDSDYATDANEPITCSYEGDELEIGFNAQSLMEMLNNLNTSLISMEMSTPNRAGIITPLDLDADSDKSENILMLIMPLLLNN